MSAGTQVVVLDDQYDIAELVCAGVSRMGMVCAAVTTAAALLGMVDEVTSVIITDIRMPDMDGNELLRELARRGCRARVVLMSGVGRGELTRVETYGRSLGLQMVGVLPKPFRLAEVMEVLRR